MRSCVNRVTPLQNIHDSNLFFSFLRYRRFSLVFQSRDRNGTKVSLSTHYLAAAKILFEFGCFALLCFAWVARIPCLSRSHRHQLQHNYKQTFDCEAKVTDVLKIVERLGKMKIYLPNFSFLMPHLSLKNLSFYSSPLNQLSLGLFIMRGPPERDINLNEI